MELPNPDLARRARALLRQIAKEHPHLSYGQLEALAQGRLTTSGLLAAHIRDCRICGGELRDLKGFVDSIKRDAKRA